MKRYWESLRPFEKRVVVGVTTGLFVIFNVWFVLPHFSDLGQMRKRMEEAQYTLGIREAAIAQTQFYQTQVGKLKKEGLDVPPQEQALQFQRAVSDEESRSGVNPKSTGRISTRTNDPFFLELSQTINVESGEQQLVDFLFNLGSGNSLIRVSDLGLHPDAPHRQLSSTIKLVASFQKNSAAKPAAPPARSGSGRLAGSPTASTSSTPTKK